MDGENPTTEKTGSVVERTDSLDSACSSPVVKKEKINVLLKPVGDAPILKQKLWAIDPEKQVAQVIQFVSRYLKLERENNLLLFVNQSFAPSPDQLIRNLYECFGADGKLVLHYSIGVAWG
jgi:ubiquitin-like protein ATG12